MNHDEHIKTIGLIGSGNIGGTVAKLAVAAGFRVVLSNSRGPETLAGLSAELGPLAQAATPQAAAQAGDLVLLTVPLRAVTQIDPKPLAGKIVIDTNNYYPDRDGRIAEVDQGLPTSQYVQRHLVGAKVVKAFNNIFFKHLQKLGQKAGDAERCALPMAGDDPESKAVVAWFLDKLGYDAVDAGGLAESWRFERDRPAYGVVYSGSGGAFYTDPGAPASVEKIKQALKSA